MVVRWTFNDPAANESWTFAVNPSEDDTPGWAKTFTYENTAAPDGRTLVFEGRDQVRKGGFSGHLTTEAEFNIFLSWYQKRNQIQLVDDLGRSNWVIIESFSPKRTRSHHHPWKHTYEVTYAIVDWP